MKARCEPGDRCVIVAEVPGCECNVGAMLTVTAALRVTMAGQPVVVWMYEDASRPIKHIACDPDGRLVPGTECWARDSHEFPLKALGAFDHHLVPLHGAGELLLTRQAEDVPA